MANYSQMTNEEFVKYLEQVVTEDYGEDAWKLVMTINGVYDAVKEEFNNEVLDMWATANPDKAYPNEDDES